MFTNVIFENGPRMTTSYCSGTDRLHACLRNEPGHNDPGRGLDKPCRSFFNGDDAVAGGHNSRCVLELARPQRAAQLAASRAHFQRKALGYI